MAGRFTKPPAGRLDARRGVLDQFLDPLVGLLLVTSQFVRVSPEQELRIVEALQGSGQIMILVDDN